MTTLDPTLIESLLRMAEGEVVDFKQAQYPFAGASDHEKSEIVKDIVAFANAWRTGDSYIVLGAVDGKGKRATLVGVANQLDDADLQQLVKSKTNRCPAFEYIPLTHDGVSIAVIRIKHPQHRPISIEKDFGKLKKGEVPIRRGSTTDIASADGIAEMGAVAERTSREPTVQLLIGPPDAEIGLGQEVTIRSTLLSVPSAPPPPREPKSPVEQMKALRGQLDVPLGGFFGPSWEDMARYRRLFALVRPLRFGVKNLGRVLAEDVRVVVRLRPQQGLVVLDEEPEKPQGPLEPGAPGLWNRLSRPAGTTSVTDMPNSEQEIEARVGKIQPGATVWSDPFWMGSQGPVELKLTASIFGDNIPAVLAVPLVIRVEIEHDTMDDPREK